MSEHGTETTELLEILKLFNIKISDKPVDITSSMGDSLGVDVEDELQGLPYIVRYSFDVCLAHGYLYSISLAPLILSRSEYTISKSFIERLKALPSAIACGILDTIVAGRKFVPEPLAYLATAETNYKGTYRIDSDRDLPAHCKRIQRCLITPTTVLLKAPSIDVTNRVIRHFIRFLDRFLRVTCIYSASIWSNFQSLTKMERKFIHLQTGSRWMKFIQGSIVPSRTESPSAVDISSFLPSETPN